MQGSADVLLPLSHPAHNTLLSIARQCPEATLRVSPFCHEGGPKLNEVRGWILDLPAGAPASGLPLNCSLFDGVSLVECQCGEPEVLRLLTHPHETRAALGRAIHAIMSAVGGEDRRATWSRCRPTENGVPKSLYSAFMGRENKVSLCSTPDAVPLIDSETWAPELSPDGFLGLYHHWHPARKRLCLYMACQSYLPRACLDFADLLRELPEHCTAHDVLHSEEVQWLRQACSRNRARLIARACEAMGLSCPIMQDYANALQGERMAVVRTETLHHDLLPSTGGGVCVLNYCSSTCHVPNGLLCSMAPAEGLWVFHGERAHQLDNSSVFGLPYARGTLFMPTQAPEVSSSAHQRTRFAFSKSTPDTNAVLRLWEHQHAHTQPLLVLMQQQQLPALLSSSDSAATGDPEIMAAYRLSLRKMRAREQRPATTAIPVASDRCHLLFDEQVLQAMARKGWDRSLGYTHLVPLACGQCHEWWMHKQLQDATQAGEAAHANELAEAGLS